MTVRIIRGDCLEEMRKLPAESVHCCVTSPPYWCLRDYGIPTSIWGGDPACEHEWGAQHEVHDEREAPINGKTRATDRFYGDESRRFDGNHQKHTAGAFCRCGAWRGAFGLEPTPALYVEHAVMIFREARRVLRDDGTLWLNLGDSYTSGGRETRDPGQSTLHPAQPKGTKRADTPPGLKPKDLCEIPSDVVRALRADGWWLRSRIPWLKRNAMPESTKDRPTTAVEYVFLLSKSERYYYDGEAVRKPSSPGTHERLSQANIDNQIGSTRAHAGGKTNGNMKAVGERPQKKPVSGWDTGPGDHHAAIGRYPQRKLAEPGSGTKNNSSFDDAMKVMPISRARRNSDWFFESWQGMLQDEGGDPLALIVNPQPFKEAHFATFPPSLIEPCILAGCPIGGTVLDPFGGAGTTGLAADRLQRDAILIELNPEYASMAEKRIHADGPLFSQVTA